MKNIFIERLRKDNQPDWVMREIYKISEMEMFLYPTGEISFVRWKWKMNTYANLKYEVVKDLMKVEPSIGYEKMMAYWEAVLEGLSVGLVS